MISFLKKYILKFYYAFAGLFFGITHDRSILLQCFIGLFVIIWCTFLHMTLIEWAIILMVIGAVIALEYMNSAIEGIVDMISPQYSESAKRIKDYAAAAVLIMSIIAATVGIVIIGGKLW